MADKLYFAYGSNMNLDQMEFRCPEARPAGNAYIEDYELTFCSRNPESGVATIRPKKGSRVNGVLWAITEGCEKNLDHYEGYPRLYGKEAVCVTMSDGSSCASMAYVMNAPYKDFPAKPSPFYLNGILEGCRQNKIPEKPVRRAARQAAKEAGEIRPKGRKQGPAR